MLKSRPFSIVSYLVSQILPKDVTFSVTFPGIQGIISAETFPTLHYIGILTVLESIYETRWQDMEQFG